MGYSLLHFTFPAKTGLPAFFIFRYADAEIMPYISLVAPAAAAADAGSMRYDCAAQGLRSGWRELVT